MLGTKDGRAGSCCRWNERYKKTTIRGTASSSVFTRRPRGKGIVAAYVHVEKGNQLPRIGSQLNDTTLIAV